MAHKIARQNSLVYSQLGPNACFGDSLAAGDGQTVRMGGVTRYGTRKCAYMVASSRDDSAFIVDGRYIVES
jgi:hypothetical protein